MPPLGWGEVLQVFSRKTWPLRRFIFPTWQLRKIQSATKFFQFYVRDVISPPMQRASSKPESTRIANNDLASLRCQKALDFKARGDYAGAQKVMRPLWQRVGGWPETTGLHPAVAAEVLYCTGILTGWLGSKNAIANADHTAGEMLNKSLTYYQSVRDTIMVAAVQIELGYRSWRLGQLNEARSIFTEALEGLRLEGNRRANALVGLSIVEFSALRFEDCLNILTENEALFKKISNHAIKGGYHNQIALVLRNLATPENKASAFQRVLEEFEQAERHFKAVRNKLSRAQIKNNISIVLRDLARFKEAHEHLNQARRLMVSIKDKPKIAHFDDSRAQLFIAEGNYAEAEVAARHAVRIFAKCGPQSNLSQALTTQGIALARLRKTERAQFTFEQAITIAHQAGSLHQAGVAALTLIEEIDELSNDMLAHAYEQAAEWLAATQSRQLLLRFSAAGKKLAARLKNQTTLNAIEPVFRYRNIRETLLQVERQLIHKALAEANGSVTYAAPLLGMTYPGLIYIIQRRHPDLLKERTPIRRRPRNKQTRNSSGR